MCSRSSNRRPDSGWVKDSRRGRTTALFYGGVDNPIEAFADFSAVQWILFLILTVALVNGLGRLAMLIAH